MALASSLIPSLRAKSSTDSSSRLSSSIYCSSSLAPLNEYPQDVSQRRDTSRIPSCDGPYGSLKLRSSFLNKGTNNELADRKWNARFSSWKHVCASLDGSVGVDSVSERKYQVANMEDILDERDACGVGFIANLKNLSSFEVVQDALSALARMEHRGGCRVLRGADNDSVDGAGIMTRIPWELFDDWFTEHGQPSVSGSNVAVGMVFLPQDEQLQSAAKAAFESICASERLQILGWRTVPTKETVAGYYAKQTLPNIQQVFVKVTAEESVDDIERELHATRKLMEKRGWNEPWGEETYFCSFSSQTIVYKGMLRSEVLGKFYLDLQNELYKSPFAIYHQRFRTNTNLRWPLTQPMRFLGHNGEINTLQGNLNWIQAHETTLYSPVWHGREEETIPIGEEKVKDFYDFDKGQMEAWDGPALMLFSDGRTVGACLDRNGLRPARYWRTNNDRLYVESEVGVLHSDEEHIVMKGRLGPGMMIVVNLETGEVLENTAVKKCVASAKPYRRWLDEASGTLQVTKFLSSTQLDSEISRRCHQSVGFSSEDVQMVTENMAAQGKEPTLMMGDDMPVVVLSGRDHMLNDNVKQRFPQLGRFSGNEISPSEQNSCSLRHICSQLLTGVAPQSFQRGKLTICNYHARRRSRGRVEELEKKRSEVVQKREDALRKSRGHVGVAPGARKKRAMEEKVENLENILFAESGGAMSVGVLQPREEEVVPVGILRVRDCLRVDSPNRLPSDETTVSDRFSKLVSRKPAEQSVISNDMSSSGLDDGTVPEMMNSLITISSFEEDDDEEWVEVGVDEENEEEDEEVEIWEGDLPPMTAEEEEEMLIEAERELAELEKSGDAGLDFESKNTPVDMVDFKRYQMEQELAQLKIRVEEMELLLAEKNVRTDDETTSIHEINGKVQSITSDSRGFDNKDRESIEVGIMRSNFTNYETLSDVWELVEDETSEGHLPRRSREKVRIGHNEARFEEWDSDDEDSDDEVENKERGIPAVMRCFDRAKIYVKAGNGGNGVVAFRREKFVPFGGPSGGKGGRGGHVYIEVDSSMNSLLPFRNQVHFRAGRGAHGGGKSKEGAAGTDITVKVPPGTIVRETGQEGKVLLELTKAGQRQRLLPGGAGGRGNAAFKTGRNNAPQLAEFGEEGVEMWVQLELKLVADVGIVGVPNAGKSTLLSAVSAAKPEIANYPFTTLLPNLGVVSMDYDVAMVVADLPGLLEGAHTGAGLGHEFLRHTERCRVLVQNLTNIELPPDLLSEKAFIVLFLSFLQATRNFGNASFMSGSYLDALGWDHNVLGLAVLNLVHVVDGLSCQPVEEYEAVRLELQLFNPVLAEKPVIVAYNKMDIPEVAERWEAFEQELQAKGVEVYNMSAATKQGTSSVIRAAHRLVRAQGAVTEQYGEEEEKAIEVAEIVKRERSAPIEQFKIVADKHTRTWQVTGAGLERFTQMTNWEYFEAVRRFQHVLTASGVNKTLREQGVKEGDTVIVGQMEFSWVDSDDMANLGEWKRGVRGSKVWPH